MGPETTETESKREKTTGPAAVVVMPARVEYGIPTGSALAMDACGRAVKATDLSPEVVCKLCRSFGRWCVLIGTGTWGVSGRLTSIAVRDVQEFPLVSAPASCAGGD